MGQALYRKHRPKKLSEVVGQDHITQTLERALKAGKISHAYLFTGPKGTGKTSIARILAHEINQLPYSDESIHLDIIEIDAASNRRIDEIRDLKDRIHIAPTSAKYKVYIIDEVHMLTREAFNALLKTLEEPPEHVVFILATTEAHKLPETIISRTQRFGFRPIDKQSIVDHLASLAKTENIAITDEALGTIAEHGDGSFRDSIALLDQLRGNEDNEITQQHVTQALGLAPTAIIEAITAALEADDSMALSASLDAAYSQAVQPAQLSVQISDGLRAQFMKSPNHKTAQLLQDLMDVHAAHNPRVALDIALFKTIAINAPSPAPRQTIQPTPADEPDQTATTPPKPIAPTKPHQAKDSKPAKTHPADSSDDQAADKPATTTAQKADATDPPTPGDWQDILIAIKGKYNTLYGIVRMAEPTFEPGSIQLGFKFPFHHKRVSEARYIDILNTIAQDVVGHPIRVSCTVIKTSASSPTQPSMPDSAPPKPDLAAITDVFGDGVSLDDA